MPARPGTTTTVTPHRTGRTRSRVASALTAAALALVLAGCGSDTTSPSAARADAPEGAALAADRGGSAGKNAGSARPPVDCEKAKCIALTFDAGPGRDTPELLDILKEKDVHATFFLLGKNHVVKYPDVVRRLADEGHEVANHTWTHRRLDRLDKDAIRDELARTQDAIAEITGKKPTLMRPPQGRRTDEVMAVSKELGLSAVLWSATAKDYSTTDSALIRKRILDQADRDGIILLHDIYDGTVPAVPGIIDELKKRGYTFVTVPELLAPGKAEPGTVYRP
ncbi:polysaccharide deacetylase family protein [Streptomyces zhihengii]|uniref:Polysaccharide deacetylase family protein n=3 Tax=Streptomyces zhihengii TaxID=1818004 RepID=A0ABS2UTU4_9ACTN|nr:polysaccharide deacetylase family protein [Streptomyces zhihengii]MBM9620966.1 polysaccharide deacetylase family protein [Streptomyces zhihengii]